MKKLMWLIAFTLATFTLRGQVDLEQKVSHWNSPIQKEINISKDYNFTVVDTTTYCSNDKLKAIEDRCVNNWSGYERKVPELMSNQINLPPKKHYKSPYVYNFRGHISGSVGIKLSEMSISKLRLEYEIDTPTDNWTYGVLLSSYTLEYYYIGLRFEGFARYYFVPNSSGEGGFLQGRIGYGRFWNGPGEPFGGLGYGVDLGNKFIVIGNDVNYSNSFTLTPMGGIQVYPGPGGTIPLAWVWQLRFGYQFGGGRR